MYSIFAWTPNKSPFVKAGQLPSKLPARMVTTLLDTAWYWKMQVDLDQKLLFPPEITTNLRLDLIIWSTLQRCLYIVELTVPGEVAVGKLMNTNAWSTQKKQPRQNSVAVVTIHWHTGIQKICIHINNMVPVEHGGSRSGSLRLRSKAATGFD